MFIAILVSEITVLGRYSGFIPFKSGLNSKKQMNFLVFYSSNMIKALCLEHL